MDTLYFEPPRFQEPGLVRSVRDYETRIGEVNLSEIEVFMLRGRRLQAQAMGGWWRRGFGKLRRLLSGSHPGPAAPLPPGRYRGA
jgi:hypothetical protein